MVLEVDIKVDIKRVATLMDEANSEARKITRRVMKRVFDKAANEVAAPALESARPRLQQPNGVVDKVFESIGTQEVSQGKSIGFRLGSHNKGKWEGVPASRNKDFNLAVALNVGVDPFPLNMIPTFKGTRAGHAFMYVKPSLFYSMLERQYIHSGIIHKGFTETRWLSKADSYIDKNLQRELDKELEKM
tara:strand:+ start:379 stop:945 length:567 start_codon:yes stop_codon:yes gene_type:complete